MRTVLQSVVLSEEVCKEQEIFYRSSGIVEKNGGGLILRKGAMVRTDTYMNMFDAELWKKYTSVKKLKLEMCVKGKGHIRVYSWSEKRQEVVAESEISSSQAVKRNFEFTGPVGMIFFEILSKGEFELQNACYSVDAKPDDMNPVHLSLIICTYHRNEQLMKIADMLKGSLFFDEKSFLYGGLSVRIVDNASELPEMEEKNFKLYRNRNTGGSGGFSRGILESRKEEEEYGITHVIFMDDDVEIITESFYRLYAMLCLMRPVYQEFVIGGRMFRMDDKKIQYTAAEIWNKGDIVHVGGNLDMRRKENLLKMNRKTGDYTGWWFACFPMRFVREHLPLPFFLHCDDVEYGLRHGGPPILVNGIQVWHETYEYRKSPMIAYYDTRNSLIVNTIYGRMKNQRGIWELWEKRLDQYYNENEYGLEYAAILAMWDYLDGSNAFLKKSEKKEIPLLRVKGLKYIASVLWRIVFVKYKLTGRKAFLSFEKILEKN